VSTSASSRRSGTTGRTPRPTSRPGWKAEEGLDRLIAIIRGGCAKLAAYCAQAASEGTFTAREAHQLLIAAGAPKAEFAALSDRPQERTRALTEFLKSPGPIEVKLRVLAGNEAAGALHDLTGIMDCIAGAVHQAVLSVFGPEGTSPVAYALAGARVLAYVGVPMIPQAGQIAAVTKTAPSPSATGRGWPATLPPSRSPGSR
jgi:hypothetical protein